MSARDSSEANAVPPAEISVLEQRYRRLLLLLPRHYRELREDEIVATFLAAQRARDRENFDIALRYGAPSWQEKRSIMVLAMRARWAVDESPARSRIRFQAAQRAVFGMLTLNAMAAVLALTAHIVMSVAPFDAETRPLLPGELVSTIGLWEAWQNYSYLAWLAALPLVLVGRRWSLLTAAIIAQLPSVTTVTRSGFGWLTALPVALWLALGVVLVIMAMCGVRLAITRLKLWLGTAASAVIFLALIQTIAYLWMLSVAPAHLAEVPNVLLLYSALAADDTAWSAWAVVLAAVIVAGRRVGASRDTATWLAITYLAVGLLLLRVSSGWPLLTLLPHHYQLTSSAAIIIAGVIIHIAALLTVALISYRRSRRTGAEINNA